MSRAAPPALASGRGLPAQALPARRLPARGLRAQLRRLLGNRLLTIGVIIMLPICVMALAAPHLTPYDPVAIDTAHKLLPMSRAHPFGTDELGRDVLTRVIHGSRISLRVGALATLFAAVSGGVLGLLAGYYRVADQLISRVVDGVVMFPGLVLGIMLMAALGPAEFNVVIAFTIITTPRIVRVIRASVLEVKEMDYVDAARVAGIPNLRLLVGHILPNAYAPALVQVSLGFADAILAEAGLSFLGIGTPPPAPSWGNILSDAREFVRTAPWLMVIPGAMITLTVMGMNLIGDGLRDRFDPKLRRARAGGRHG